VGIDAKVYEPDFNLVNETTGPRHLMTRSRLESSPLVRKTRCCINTHGLQWESPSLVAKKVEKPGPSARVNKKGC